MFEIEISKCEKPPNPNPSKVQGYHCDSCWLYFLGHIEDYQNKTFCMYLWIMKNVSAQAKCNTRIVGQPVTWDSKKNFHFKRSSLNIGYYSLTLYSEFLLHPLYRIRKFVTNTEIVFQVAYFVYDDEIPFVTGNAIFDDILWKILLINMIRKWTYFQLPKTVQYQYILGMIKIIEVYQYSTFWSLFLCVCVHNVFFSLGLLHSSI